MITFPFITTQTNICPKAGKCQRSFLFLSSDPLSLSWNSLAVHPRRHFTNYIIVFPHRPSFPRIAVQLGPTYISSSNVQQSVNRQIYTVYSQQQRKYNGWMWVGRKDETNFAVCLSNFPKLQVGNGSKSGIRGILVAWRGWVWRERELEKQEKHS